MRSRIGIDHAHSHAIAQEIGERLRGLLKEQTELPPSIRRRMVQLRELESESPSIIPTFEKDAERKDR